MAQTAIRQLVEGTWARVYKPSRLGAALLAGFQGAEVRHCFQLIAYAWKLNFMICLSNIVDFIKVLKSNGSSTLIDFEN